MSAPGSKSRVSPRSPGVQPRSPRLRPRNQKALHCSCFFTLPCKVSCPTGGVREFLSSPPAKNIMLPFFRNACYQSRHPASPRGARRDRHVRGVGCGGRSGAWDERFSLRTVKPCGSGAPKQASSPQDANASRGWRGQQSGGPREERGGNCKTTAWGMPDVSGASAV